MLLSLTEVLNRNSCPFLAHSTFFLHTVVCLPFLGSEFFSVGVGGIRTRQE